ncbi:MAG: hypothetical protein U9Q61_05060 [Thermodesulfobacteriota bacterium]|nr:hypothetical protein [Thermodesulfobacteriota bacterium]
MYHFDITKEPLSNPELKAELQAFKETRKELIKYSCISDVLHSFIFIGLYFSQFLSGYAVLVAVVLSTAFALFLATVPRQSLKLSDRIAIGAIALGTAVATVLIINMVLQQPLTGSLVAGLTAGSIVIVGATLGRKIKNILMSIETLKPIPEDTVAHQELNYLCRKYPQFDEYREQATLNLRPHLSYGELAAMKRWMEEQDVLPSP